ncbi:MAG: histidine phosphatase family protein [Chloroflexota bacterium]
MELYIIRHAQSENNAIWARTRSNDGRLPDPPLTELGHQQAALLAEHLATGDPHDEPNYFARRHNRGGYGLTHLYTSLMIRSVATAGYIAEATGLPLIAWPDIHERGGLHEIDVVTGEERGVAGPNRDYFIREFPALVLPEELGDEGWWNRPPERVEEAYPRARRVWNELIERHGGTEDRVAIVSHGGFFQALLVTVLGGIESEGGEEIPLLGPIWLGLSNTGINRLFIDNEFGAIQYTNRVNHLPSELITG